MSNIQQNLKNLNIVIPQATVAVANYQPYITSDKYLFISGQLPMVDGKLKYNGKVGQNISIEQASEAAALCAINVLAQAQAALNNLNKIKKLIKLTIFIATSNDFTQHSYVGNGASDLFVNILGEKGKHSRSAIGVNSLPFDAPVEIEAIFEIEKENNETI
ncbi:RidA family protein [Bartonella sp. DGB1]|uniref:RidA family protein n=1 Tax=Bartonella sp. DGB1 TaxID=3239807 RepID=UPI0035239F85